MSENDEKNIRIYMPLLNEGTIVVRPVTAEALGGGIYRISPLENTGSEQWEFPPGSLVKCVKEVWEDDEILVARDFA